MADSIKTARGDDQYMLRLPAGMRDEIKASAEANGRSMNAEIIARLVGQQSLRDHFAGLALSATLMNSELCRLLKNTSDAGEDLSDAVAIHSYELADAMIAARKAGA